MQISVLTPAEISSFSLKRSKLLMSLDWPLKSDRKTHWPFAWFFWIVMIRASTPDAYTMPLLSLQAMQVMSAFRLLKVWIKVPWAVSQAVSSPLESPAKRTSSFSLKSLRDQIRHSSLSWRRAVSLLVYFTKCNSQWKVSTFHLRMDESA